MRCRKVRGMLSDYIGAELSDTKRQQIDGHLTECPDCRAALGQLHEVWDGLAGQPLPQKDEAFWGELTRGVMHEIRKRRPMPADEKRTPLFSGWRVLVPATAAVAIAIIIVGLIVFRWGPHESTQWIAQGDQQALVAAAPDLSFGPLASDAEDPLEQEITLHEVSLVAETLTASLQSTEGATITDLLTQLFTEEDLYGQLQGLTDGELEELDQLLSAKYPYS
jgi:predicted anti-sigma-YlaC factor YlaD